MKCNVGGMDMVARLVIGAVLLLVAFTAQLGLVWQVVLLVLAAIAIITGLVHYCPVNTMLGINTCKPKAQHTEHHGT